MDNFKVMLRMLPFMQRKVNFPIQNRFNYLFVFNPGIKCRQKIKFLYFVIKLTIGYTLKRKLIKFNIY
jgi:hypothetical protein